MDTPAKLIAPKTRIIDLANYSNEFPPGTKIDRYEIVATLGSGGCGVVYAARHVHLDQTVALKLLHRALVHSEERVNRFFREARAAAAVGNAHIVRVSDCGISPDGIPFLAMEFLKGVVLEHLVENEQAVALDRAVDIELQILDGLEAAHAAGVVHRDLKPENIFLVPSEDGAGDFVKIVDFGVSKVFKDTEHYQKAITGTGALLGTPRYMAPEQFRGARDVDHRADIFAAAVVLFQMLSGKLPFDGRTPLELAHRASTQPPHPLDELVRDLPEGMREVVEQGLAKDPNDRWDHARAFATALRRVHRQWRERGDSSISTTIPVGGRSPFVPLADDDDEPTFQTPVNESDFTGSGAFAPFGALDDPLAETTPREPPPERALEDPFAERAPDDLVGFGEGRSTIPTPFQAAAPFVQGEVGDEARLASSAAPAGEASQSSSPAFTAPESVSSPLLPAAMPAPSAPPQEGTSSTVLPPSATKKRPWRAILLFGALTIIAGVAVGIVLHSLIGDHLRAEDAVSRGAPSVVFESLDISGQVSEQTVRELLESSRVHLEMCREPGESRRVALEAHIAPPGFSTSRLSLLRGAPSNEASESVTDCCVGALRESVPAGWSPGQSGVFTVSIVLPGR